MIVNKYFSIGLADYQEFSADPERRGGITDSRGRGHEVTVFHKFSKNMTELPDAIHKFALILFFGN